MQVCTRGNGSNRCMFCVYVTYNHKVDVAAIDGTFMLKSKSALDITVA